MSWPNIVIVLVCGLACSENLRKRCAVGENAPAEFYGRPRFLDVRVLAGPMSKSTLDVDVLDLVVNAYPQ
jgi:hypothetical protein